MIVLGIESSCDETGVGLVRMNPDGRCEQLADEVASSVDQHARFGGVVPEIASRAHLEAIVPTMRRALAAAGVRKPDAVAVTIGPGLVGALLVGVAAAKAYAAAWDVPFYALNHLGGHVAVDTLEHGPMPPCVALLVSGGHTHLLKVTDLGEPIEELGSTVDDAAGEAFDKVARLLGLGYPGGPAIDALAVQGDPTAIAFPRGMSGPRDARYDFSFSGLKTAVARYVESHELPERSLRSDRTPERSPRSDRTPERSPRSDRTPERSPRSDRTEQQQQPSLADVAASFQEAVADVLTSKAVCAAGDMGVDTIVLGGGATANSRIRSLAEERCAAAGLTLRVPKPRLCTDNGVMIAALGAHVIAGGAQPSSLRAECDPGLPVGKTQAN